MPFPNHFDTLSHKNEGNHCISFSELLTAPPNYVGHCCCGWQSSEHRHLLQASEEANRHWQASRVDKPATVSVDLGNQPKESHEVSALSEAKKARSPHQPVGRWIRPERRLAIYLRDSFLCQYCGRDLHSAVASEVTLDHLMPRSKGGNNRNENLITACRRCNSQRGSKPWTEYATGGAIDRIRLVIWEPINLDLARAILADRAGDDTVESAR